jgi:hypothetical protein
MDKSKSSVNKRRKQRILMLLAGIGLGLVCRALPEKYHGPCSVITSVVARVMGLP